MLKQSIDSSFKTRINDLLLLNEALVSAVDEFYESFDDVKLKGVEVAYDGIVKLISTPINNDEAIPYKARLNEDERVRLVEAMDMNLSEVKANPIECYSQEWDLTITNVLGLVYVGNKCYKVDYILED